MTVRSKKDLEALRRIGRIVALALKEMEQHVRPGITTAELDAIGRAFLEAHGALSAPDHVYDFPGATCISVNNEAAHGIPGPRVIEAGDLVNIDVSASLDGYFADTGATIPVPPVSPEKARLCESTKRALDKAMAAARAGSPLFVIGKAIEEAAERAGYTIIENLAGHGVGRHLHEEPHFIRNTYDPNDKRRLTDGLVITIEPFFTTGARTAKEASDGWTLLTPPGTWVAQYEHTLVVRDGQPLVLTAV